MFLTEELEMAMVVRFWAQSRDVGGAERRRKVRVSAPSKEVLEAVFFLLAQDDSADYRRQARMLVRSVPLKDSQEVWLDFTEFDAYVVNAAQVRRAALGAPSGQDSCQSNRTRLC